MSPPNPERLFEQATALAQTQACQTDLRRAISAAYYGLFHFTLTAAANMVVGADKQSNPRYGFVYRSIDHSRLRALGTQLRSTALQGIPLVPAGGFGKIADFARLAGNLYELRNLADYDPLREFTLDEARVAISDAQRAIEWFRESTREQQEVFLTLLLFKSR